MSLTGVGEVAGLFGKVIDKIWPNKDDAEKAKLELFKLQQNGELQGMLGLQASDAGQVMVNKAEAESGSSYRGGWRPLAGWICGFGLGYQFLVRPLASWLALVYGLPELPALDMESLMALLFGMLGLGYYRSREKISGIR